MKFMEDIRPLNVFFAKYGVISASLIIVLLTGVWIYHLIAFQIRPALSAYHFFFFNPTTEQIDLIKRRYDLMSERREDQIKELLNLYLLGTASIKHQNLIPVNVKVRSVLADGGDLYINLNREFITYLEREREKDVVALLTKTIHANFPEFSRLYLSAGLYSLPFIHGSVLYQNGLPLEKDSKGE